MIRESFERWRIPPEIDGIVLLEDLRHGPGRTGLDQRHRHAELELHLVARGRGTFLLGESRIDADAGTLLWVPPQREHTLLDPTADFQRWMLLSRPRLVRRALPPGAARGLLAREAASAGDLSRSLARPLARELARRLAEGRGGGREHFAIHNATIGYLLGQAYKAFAGADALPMWSALHPAVAAAVRALRDGAADPSRAELARLCGTSEWHLSKLFHAQVGVSLVDFRNRCRLERFLEVYGDGTRCKMAAAALDAGFGSYPQFHRVFKASLGYAPAEHARRLREDRTPPAPR